MAYIETALVSSSGRLLIQLDDGTVIDAGYVKGERGPSGRDGRDGAPGIPGARGEAGANGSQWFTGVGAPEIQLGENSDLYLDVASSMLPIYQKVSGDWLFLSNLKATPVGSGGGGAGGAAGGGGSVIIYPQPDGGLPPSKDNDGNNISKGDLWYDPNTGLLWVYNGTKWLPIGDRPPVSVNPTPPLFNSSGDTNNRYPVREGDLWFDNEQGALYVGVTNVDGDLVWVISTPANRDILQTEIPGAFVIPASTNNGDTFYNAITDTWYIYNQPKRQWIDLPPGERELSFPGILLEADAAIDETFEGTGDGNVYINNPDHEPTTRLVVRRIDSKGFDWSDILSEIVVGDGISLVQQLLIDPNDDTYETQRVDYLIEGLTANTDSYSFLVSYDKQNMDRDPLFGETVSVRFLAQVQPPAVCVNYGDTVPDPKCVGHLWFDSSDTELTLYIYTGTEWIPAAPPVSLDGINATIDAALLIQADLVDRVTAGETAQTSLQGTVSSALETQQGIQEDILTLQQEIDALENTRYVGTWNAIDDASKNGRPPGDGNFYFNQGGLATDWNLVGWLYIADVDSNGVSFTHSDIQVGDQIEVISKTENSYGIYTIQSTSDAGDYIAIQIEGLNRSDGVPTVGPHLIKIFSIDNGIDLGEADARYMKLRGNQQLDKDVTWRVRQDSLDDSGNTFISIKDGEMNLYHLAYPGADTHAANQQYVNDQDEILKEHVDTADGVLGQMITLNGQDIAKKVEKTGDTMTGELKINVASGYNHLLLKTGGTNVIKVGSYTANETRLQVYNGQFFKVVGYVDDTLTQLFGVSSSGRVTLANVRTPTADRDAATKAYVDSLLAAPARLSWKWNSTSSGDSAPPTGSFKYTQNGSDYYYRFSLETAEGISLGESIISEFNRSIENGPVGTIWYKDSNGWKFKQQFRINTFRWNFNNHFEFRVTSRNGSTSFTPGTPYHITVGGFF